MSDNVLRFVATDPDLLPDGSVLDAARRVVARAFPLADTVEVAQHDAVHFIDCGANLESVRCPACGTDLLEGGTWMDLMDASWKSGMTERGAVVPCCGATTALEDLDYHWPVAFGRFSIDVWNPGVAWFHADRRLEHEEKTLLAAISAVLGVPVRGFWAHV